VKTRIEKDSFGEIEVPADRYWGAQTQRSLENFKIGVEHFPRVFIRAYGIIKQAAAEVNARQGGIPEAAAAAWQIDISHCADRPDAPGEVS